MIDRSAIIVRAKEPFLQWLRQLPDPVGPDMTLDCVNEEPTVYLAPEYGYIDEQSAEGIAFGDLNFTNASCCVCLEQRLTTPPSKSPHLEQMRRSGVALSNA